MDISLRDQVLATLTNEHLDVYNIFVKHGVADNTRVRECTDNSQARIYSSIVYLTKLGLITKLTQEDREAHSIKHRLPARKCTADCPKLDAIFRLALSSIEAELNVIKCRASLTNAINTHFNTGI